MNVLYSVFMLILILVSDQASAGSVGCYDEANGFTIEAPRNWQTQYSSGPGPCAFFFPKGWTWDNSPVVIYPNLVSNKKDLDAFIKDDLASFIQKTPSIIIESRADIKTRKGLKFVLRRISQGRAPNEYELVAYLRTSRSVLISVLSTRSATDLKNYEEIFGKFLEDIQLAPRSEFFKVLKKRADLEKNLPGGEEFEIKYTKALAPYLIPSFEKCAKGSKDGFDAVLQIDARGVIVSWLNAVDTQSGLCARQELQNFQGPVPPFEPFHVNLTVTIKP